MPSRKEKKRRKELLKQYQASHEKGQVSYHRTAGQVPDRRAMEKVAVFFGLILGMGLACLIAKIFVPGSSIWTAAILGALSGGFGGLIGQSFIEGIIVAAMCSVILATFLSLPITASFPVFVQDIAVGWAAGTATGWFLHGLIVR